jgi:hypothetical protein
VILFGHVGGVPVEEMLPAAPAAAAGLLMAARVFLHGVHNVRRMRRPDC